MNSISTPLNSESIAPEYIVEPPNKISIVSVAEFVGQPIHKLREDVGIEFVGIEMLTVCELELLTIVAISEYPID